MVRRPRDLDSIFGDDGSPIISDTELNEIQISELKPYPGHGFKLYSDIRMQKMVESINAVGILQPVIAYEQNGELFLLAGYNRVEGCKLAHKETIMAIVKRNLTKVQQVEIINFTNFFQRGTRDFSLSELAKAFRMEYEVLLQEKKHNKDDMAGNVVRTYLADMYEMTDSKMQRYLTLSKLIPELLDCLDLGIVKVSVALVFAVLDDKQQLKVYECLKEYSGDVSIKTAKEIKKLAMDDSVETIQMINLTQSQEDSKQGDEGSKMKKESNEFDDTVINKSLEFTQQLLPNWFKEHHIQVNKDPNAFIIDILEKVYQKLPELLLEEQFVN